MTIRSRRTLTFVTGLLLMVAVAGAVAENAGTRPQYTIVRVALGSRADVLRIAGLGIALEGARLRDTTGIELLLCQREVQTLRDAGFAVQVVIPDWHAAYALRQKSDFAASVSASRARGFHLGSMGGYLTLDEVEAVVDSMHLLYPHLIGKRDSIGRSIEGRTIWAVRIAGTSAAAGDAPRALYTALHHAREPEGLMVLVYFMWYVLEQYGVDPEITALLNTRELHFVPVVNPDGYAYNAKTDPAGNGMWRKNRRANSDGSFGIDLNRNYGYQWGVDDYGSSGNGSYETYRGAAAFSEPETQAIRDFCLTMQPTAALNYHTYGNVLIHPWGYIDNPTPDSLVFRRLAKILTADNYYIFGTSTGTIDYVTNGDSDDWMYGDTTAKPRIFAVTAEVGGYDDYFWPTNSRILPLADANLAANIRFAQYAGQHLSIVSGPAVPVGEGDNLTIVFRLANVGLLTTSAVGTLRFESNEVDIVSSSRSTVALNETSAVSLTLQRRSGVPDGTLATVRVLCEFDGGRLADSLSFRLGVPVVVFNDTASSASPYWEASVVGSVPTWGYTTRTAFSGNISYADSPWDDYAPNRASTFRLREVLPLLGTAAELRFMARWKIEPEYDFCLVEVSRDSGSSWISLPGRHTRPASGVSRGKQIEGTWGYDRTNDAWVEECIDLAPALGAQAMLQFRFLSDSYVEYDGFFVDDVKVLLYADAATSNAGEGGALPDRMQLKQNWPNPFNPTTVVSCQLPVASRVRLVVCDLLGREVAVLMDENKEPGRYTVTWDARAVSSGVYICRMMAEGFAQSRKMLLLK